MTDPQTTDWRPLDGAPNWLRIWAHENMRAGSDSMQLAISPEYDWYIVAQNHGTAGGNVWQKLDYPRLDRA